jgi:hypothetical protein
MKDAEDEAFDELARKQGSWGGGFPAKRQMAADKLQEPIYNITVFDNAHPKGIPLEDWVQPAQEPDMQTGIAYQKGFHDGKQAALAQPAQEPVAHILQFMKELRPAIGPMAVMGKSKTTQEWFDIVINEIERLQSTKEKNT